MEEVKTTPEERALAYKKQQDEIYESFTAEFKGDEKYLASEPNFTERTNELAKLKSAEMKKLEKTVKKELNDVEDVFSVCKSE